jgi:hypothetical protein
MILHVPEKARGSGRKVLYMAFTIIEMVLSWPADSWGPPFVFTNAIEILGQRLNLGEGSTGSLLAAVGTALPETMIPVVALVGAALAGENASAGPPARSASGRSSGLRSSWPRSRCSS